MSRDKGRIAVIGSGKLGKGFIGAVFLDADWKETFFDNDEKVIKNLEEGRYIVEVHEEAATYNKEYRNYDAYLLDERHNCKEQLVQQDIWAMTLYPESFASAVHSLIPALKSRIREKKKLSVLIFTNKNYFVKEVKTMILDELDEEEKENFDACIELSDAIIIRSTFSSSNFSDYLQTIQTMNSYISRLKYADISGVSWLQESDSIEKLKDIKLYAINSWHAAGAYAGKYKGLKTYDEVLRDEFCNGLIDAIQRKGSDVLQKEYHLSEEEIKKVQLLKNPKDPIEDSIERVACDPVRKLGKKDRLVYPALLCEKYGIDSKEFEQAIALAFLYCNPKDEQAVEIQEFLKFHTIGEAVERYCGLVQEENLNQKICKWYEMFLKGKVTL